MQRLSFAYHDSKGIADSLYRIQNDTYSFQWILLNALTPLMGAVFTLIGMMAVLSALEWRLALVALAICPILMLITSVSRDRMRRGWETAKQLESGALSVVHETLTGLRVVKAFGQEEREHRRFLSQSQDGKSARMRLAYVQGSSRILFAMTTATGAALVLHIGVQRVQGGGLTVGDLVLAMGYLAQLYLPAQLISGDDYGHAGRPGKRGAGFLDTRRSARHNEHWVLERLQYRLPAQARRNFSLVLGQAASFNDSSCAQPGGVTQ